MDNEIVIVTGNASKALEIESILGIKLPTKELDIKEIQSLDVAEVAADKALKAYQILGRPVIVDDTGMTIKAAGGLPGALVAWFLDSVGTEGILKLIEGASDRSASVSTAIGYADENGVMVFVGTIKGRIALTDQGNSGFGYDTIFIPNGSSVTYAEMSSDEKNKISMRTIALRRLKEYLNSKEI